jgi:hypothetical protein
VRPADALLWRRSAPTGDMTRVSSPGLAGNVKCHIVVSICLGVHGVLALGFWTVTPGRAQGGEPTLWEHNGSIVYLVATGSSREFYYKEPRPGMQQAGVRPGSLLFSGQAISGQYSGTAFIFNRRCGQFPYQVSGPILDNYERVVLTGQAPRVGSNCRVVGYVNDRLEFTLVRSGEPPTRMSRNSGLPPAFQGHWTMHVGNGNEVPGVGVAARSYLEPGYNCDIQSVEKSTDDADSSADVYIVNMMCRPDGVDPGPAEQVRETWAMREVNGETLLVIGGISSIRILQRAP